MFSSALAALVIFLIPSSALAGGLPVNPSQFGVSRICATPEPGFSGCMGLRLVPDEPSSEPGVETVSEPSASPEGSASPEDEAAPQVTEHTEPIKGSLTPANLISAYGLAGAVPPSTQTIALVDAYDDATIAADLEVFSQRFNLPACNEANGCFSKVNQKGKASPLPASTGAKERGWAQEIATDVEVAHGVCPSCQILLVEANTNENKDLYAAEQTAASLGASEISNSWGGPEGTSDSNAFNHPGIVITASSGDNGYLDWFSKEPAEFANYPASSPHVIGVGGTRLTLSAAKIWESETVWNDGGKNGGVPEGAGASGGGCSGHFSANAWQQSVPDWPAVGCGDKRAVTDISADGDPYSGVAVYDSTETEGEKGWFMIGGTSVASPIIASIFALAGGAQGYSYPAQMLYENLQQNPASLHDISAGSNGECTKKFKKTSGQSGCTTSEQAASCSALLICLAAPGYDGPSGVGSPNGLDAFRPPGSGGGNKQSLEGEEEATGAPTPAPEPPPTGTSSPGADGQASANGAAATPTVSALSLTRTARAALRRHPRLTKLGFAFTLNLPARVRVTLSRRVRVHGRMQWRAVSSTLAFNARGGAQTKRLSGRASLARGSYLLTVTPERGAAKSIIFKLG
ncbi:MAG TPA: S53 family peptidase [Solirubrobacteraceae bacterium]|nr:S53 family peptidase [Solirubrobacteraceae bacterium]